MPQITGKHFIAGDWVASTGETFCAVNPATGEELAPAFCEAGEAEVDRALREAYLDPDSSADLLEAIAQKIMDLGDELLERAEQETALPRPRLTGERGRTCGQIQMFAKIAREGSWVDAVIDTADPNRKPAPKPDLRRMLRPRGPVVVFGASNFPLAFGALGGDTASALAAGCPVVVKGHPSHPGTSELLASAVLAASNECKVPPEAFSLLQGRSHALSNALVRHPRTAAVGFTGSLKAGRALFDLAAAREKPIPVFAEMGSVNPLVVLPGAIAERGEKIAQELAGSVLLGGGQFCTKPGIIFTIGDDAKFMSALAQHVSSAAAPTMLNRGLRENFCGRVEQFDQVSGVKKLAAGQAQGHAQMGPTLFETSAEIWKTNPKLHEEAFGPGALVVHCKNLDQAIACIDAIEGSLTGTVHMSGSDDASEILKHLEERVGRIVINGYPTGVEVNNAIVHGGPYPATTDSATTSVGSAAIVRFARMIAYQDAPQSLLPKQLQNDNPMGIWRIVDEQRTRDPIS